MNFNREITIEPVFYESITFEIKLKRMNGRDRGGREAFCCVVEAN